MTDPENSPQSTPSTPDQSPTPSPPTTTSEGTPEFTDLTPQPEQAAPSSETDQPEQGSPTTESQEWYPPTPAPETPSAPPTGPPTTPPASPDWYAPQPPFAQVHNQSNPGSVYYGPAGQTNQLALWSMILGILAFPLGCLWGVGFFASVAALVTGYMARKQPLNTTDTTRAKAGIILGWVGVVLSVLGVLLIGILAIVGADWDYSYMGDH